MENTPSTPVQVLRRPTLDDSQSEPDPTKIEALKEIILDLHAGEDFEKAKRRFERVAKDVTHAEIAEMEQQLIRDGLPESEIKRLCDVHVAVFRESLDQQSGVNRQAPDVPSGHPLHTFRAENAALERVIDELKGLLSVLGTGTTSDKSRLAAVLDEIRDLSEELLEFEKHYLRKENQLFPALERHGFEGPTKVMWSLHDDIRERMKEYRAALEGADIARLKDAAAELLPMMSEMVYKEERILFPTSFDVLKEEDWIRIRQGEDELGYAMIEPGDEWEHSSVSQDGSEIFRQRVGAGAAAEGAAERLPLDTGLLSVEQLNLILRNLPVDISYADENDEVRFYSEGERIFPRSPGVIGRKVQNCHPPNSVHVVEKILQEFRAGSKDSAEFWLELGGKFVHVRYFALRDQGGTYRGTLEVVQDVTHIRQLSGQRRLLDW
jgi:DUF438 domain-containing protein